MKTVCWAAVLLIFATARAPAQNRNSKGSPTQARTSRHVKTPPVAVPVCKHLEGLGTVIDDAENKGKVDHILAATVGVDSYFGDLSPDDPDSTWDELVECANQTHDDSERAEALRVAAMWEHWRAALFKKAYRDALPVPTPACKDLDRLRLDVDAGWPMPDGAGSYHFPPNYRFPGDLNQIKTRLTKCVVESQKLNRNKPVPEYVRASQDIGSLNVFSEMETSTATQSNVAPIAGLEASNEPQSAAVPQISAHRCEQIITVAGLTPSGLALYVPPEGERFMAKNASNYPRMCLVEQTNATSFAPTVPHYLLVWAYSEGAFVGFQPVRRTTTAPVSGTGTLRDFYGGVWNFTYTGTMMEIDTVEAPYVVQSRTLYLRAYDEKGNVVSQHSITTSSQTGGDASYTAGYNAGAIISLLWNNPSNLVKNVLKDVQK